MTKGALKQRWIPHDPEWHDSDLFAALVTDFGLGAPTVWMVLKSEWIEPEAEIQERTVDDQPTRGLYRRCRFSYIWAKLPGIGNKKLSKIMLWLHERDQWTLDPESVQDLSSRCTVGVQSMHRRDTQTRHLVGAWSAKWLTFREACLDYRPVLKESKGEDIKDGFFEPNQNEEKPSFKYVLNEKTGEYDRVSLAEKELREDIDA